MSNSGYNKNHDVVFKLGIIAGLILLLLVPLGYINGLIKERESLQKEVKEEIGAKYGGVQYLSGPFISVPYYVGFPDQKSNERQVSYLHILPQDLYYDGNIDTSLRRRNIYKLLAYEAQFEVSGSFNLKDLEAREIKPEDILWDKAVVNLGITDVKGISERIILHVDSADFQGMPGMIHDPFEHRGVHFYVPVSSNKNITFSMQLNVKGSEAIYLLPMGKNTFVKLASKCPNPSFNGAYLPDYETNKDGFKAEWNIMEINRSFPQIWFNDIPDINESAFGLELLLDVDHYQKTQRSVKYAILFLSLTFLSFFFIEARNTRRIHPVQYTLIGFMLVIFYVLLLSFSEQIGFNMAYGISAAAVLLLVMIYNASIFKSKTKAFYVTALLTLVYSFIFVIIQLETYSLLVGSIGLFLFIAVIMIQSRNVDWYKLVDKNEPKIDDRTTEQEL